MFGGFGSIGIHECLEVKYLNLFHSIDKRLSQILTKLYIVM